MKRIILGLMLIFSALSFSVGYEIQNMRFNSAPAQFVLDIDGSNMPKYTVNYDEGSRLMFVEFEDSKVASSLSKQLQKNDGFIEKVEYINITDSLVGFFITLEEGVQYKVSTRSNPVRFVLDFSRKGGKKPIIVIDPGHGGKDPGAVNGNYYEKNLVLKVSKLLKDKLKKDFTIIMTRSTDTFISLGGRSRIANSNNADLLVSVHANASPSKSATGFEIFYYSKKQSEYAKKLVAFENSVDEKFGIKASTTEMIVNDIFYRQNQERSAFLAEQILMTYPSKLGMKDRGSHGGNLAVLRGAQCPSILIEIGFISNNNEASRMFKKSNQEKMADSIAAAIKEYFK